MTAAISESQETTALMTADSQSIVLSERLAVDMCDPVRLKSWGVSQAALLI